MPEHLKFPFTECGPISREALKYGFSEFRSVAEHIRTIPYGRPREGADVLSVLKERRGTCSSKHCLLAALAHECGHKEVELIVGVYEMTEDNTPGVGSVLSEASITSIPEAHCYLKVAGYRYDFTGLPSGVSSPFDSLLSEEAVLPDELPEKKLRLHHGAMVSWAVRHNLELSQAWRIRESCIETLAAGQ